MSSPIHTMSAHARPSAADQYRRAWTVAEIQANSAAIAFGTGALRQLDPKSNDGTVATATGG